MDYAEYNEAVLALSAEKLAGVKNWIEFSSPTEGATITKIEISGSGRIRTFQVEYDS